MVLSIHQAMRRMIHLHQPSKFLLPFSSSSSSSSQETQTQESIIYVLKNLDKTPSKALEFFNHAAANPAINLSPSAYNLMLRILGGHRDHIADFWPFLKSMDSLGLPVDNDTYTSLCSNFKKLKMVSEFSALKNFYSQKSKDPVVAADEEIQSAARIILDSDNWDGKLDFLSLSETSMAKIIMELQYSPRKALAFFRWADAGSSVYEHGSVTYNLMARVLARDVCVKGFWELVEEMEEKGFHMDIDTYIKLSRRFLKNKMMEDAVKLYEFMMDGPYKPSVNDCGHLLRQISWSGNPDLGLVSRVVGKYEAAGYSLSKTVYDGIHRSLTSNGRFDEAKDIVKRMREAGYEPDNITYSQMVFGLCKAKRLDEACVVLDRMQEDGCVPDLKTWTILIQGHCVAGEVDKALELFAKMIEGGSEADGDLLDMLVKGLCGHRNADHAYKVVVEMVTIARLKPWQATYKYLITELLTRDKLEEALKVIGLMKSHGYPPFADPFPAYISKFGTVEDAQEFLKALTVKVCPTHTAYLHVFKSFLEEGRYSEAQKLLFSSPHHIRKHPDIAKLFGSVKVESDNAEKAARNMV